MNTQPGAIEKIAPDISIQFVLAGIWFGLRAAIAASLAITALYVLFVVMNWDGFSVTDFSRLMEVVVLNGVAVVLGLISEREKRAQKSLRESESLAAMGKALSAAAHDMKSPLTAGRGFTRLVHRRRELQTFTFEMLIFVELLDVLIIRERKHFWSSRPSRSLFLIIMADLVLVFLISVLGLPGISPIPVTAALVIPLLSSIAVFVVNDPIKAMLVKRFWPRL